MAACIPVKSQLIRLLVKKALLLKMQQLILGTGTAIWWLKEPHQLQWNFLGLFFNDNFQMVLVKILVKTSGSSVHSWSRASVLLSKLNLYMWANLLKLSKHSLHPNQDILDAVSATSWQHGSQICLGTFIWSKITNLPKNSATTEDRKNKQKF